MGREIRFKRNSRGSIALQDSMLTNNLAQAIIKSSDSSPISSNPLQASESDSSDDDATDYPYQTNGEYGTDVATMTRKPAAQKEDPGPSVRARTAAELDATIKAQVEDPHYPGLDTAGLPMLRNFLTAAERKIRDLHPERTELDWKNSQPRPLISTLYRRAAQGQLCGLEAPADHKCTRCAHGKGQFMHCRIVFANTNAQWMWACASCVFFRRPYQYSFRPDVSPNVPAWVIAAVAEREPSNPLLCTYYSAKDIAIALELSKSTSRNLPAPVAHPNPEKIDDEYVPSEREPQQSPHAAVEVSIVHPPTHQPTIGSSRVRGSTVSNGTPATQDIDEEQPAKRRKSNVGPIRVSRGTTKDAPKRRKPEPGPAKPSGGATKDAPPKLKNGGLPFNTTWYNSPLEDPEVYRMKDKGHAIDTYNDLAAIIARATEDYSRMKAALLRKGFLPQSGDEESEEENVFSVD
ncbi:hypothetical protein DTO013E5_9444 [Penicillium roqueforti]|uniref:Uncharacterized protein n=1 Tax=Penicillium roqueforti (strain FM164) TaxID=1365484 RepID=W6QKZ8_PENRF|nr:uncharacterized protein LCP9604111_9671 [Penicillium roqueforti]CDM37125.1 hypothetical protein PROQFM164_S06g000085 [Penicillium roqueforti FM164]KAF9237699.1 hypothetical protein LCP9604111_9671 [Penicillium roqueforti]KAI1833467.1 hypothetical protein CBS147337_5965 [Penicillium roqueforti]KAI2671697.1 hypothetical protein LCP963914a_9626 [Penicillium roqueforti]KAI2671741.1 hypothetical protein CBS147355_8384 [Penicillium roqueforti]